MNKEEKSIFAKKCSDNSGNRMRNIVAFSIILLLLSYESLIWYAFNQGIFFANSIKFILIAFISICSLCIFLRKEKQAQYYDNSIYKSILTFFLLFIYIFIPTISNGDLLTSIIFYIKIVTLFLIFIMIFFLVKELNIIENLKKMLAAVGVIFSLQQILLFLLIYNGVNLEREVVQGQTSDAVLGFYGLLGYDGVQISNLGGGAVLRASSYFSESTRFGIFLIYPLMYFTTLNAVKPTLWAMLWLLIVSLGIFVAGSTSVLFAIIVTLASYCVFLMVRRKLVLAISFLAFFALVVSSIYYYHFLNLEQFLAEDQVTVFSGYRKAHGSVDVRVNYLFSVYEYVINNPLGSGVNIDYSDSVIGETGKLPLGLVGWFRDGGLIGLLLFSTALFFFLSPASTLLKNGICSSHSGPLALVAFFIASNLNGTLFCITFFLLCIIIAREARLVRIGHLSQYKR